MTPVFVDTSFVIALLNARDAFHKKALGEQRRLGSSRRSFVTTEAVLLELGDAFSSRERWLLFAPFLAALRRDPRATILPLNTRLLDRAVELRSSRLDKDWGLTDCVSFTVMKELSLRDALTSDGHFTQAGFNAMLRPKKSAPAKSSVGSRKTSRLDAKE